VVALISTQSMVRLRRGAGTSTWRGRSTSHPGMPWRAAAVRPASQEPSRRGAAPRPDVVPGTAGPVRAAPLPAAAIATCGRGSTSARPSSLRTRATAHAT
jgi:hypothetical protein